VGRHRTRRRIANRIARQVMKQATPRLPWLATRVLTLLLPHELRDEMLGDMAERWAERVERHGRPLATLDYWNEIVRMRPIALRIALHRSDPMRRNGRRERAGMMGTFIDDLRYGFRRLVSTPTHTVLALATLAFGIGATTAIFSVVDGVLLRPLAYEQPERLVALNATVQGLGTDDWYGSSEPELIDIENLDDVFASVGAFSYQTVIVGDSTEPRRIDALLATAGLFPALGVEPLIGRTFTPEDDVKGNAPLAVISWDFWQAQFGGSTSVLDQPMRLSDREVRIVGVMPRGFAFPDPSTPMWLSMRLDRVNPWARNNHYLEVVGRLRNGIGLERARARLDALAATSSETYPEFYPDRGYRIRTRSLHEQVVGDVQRALWVILGAVGVLLAIACVNVASLLLARGEARRREIAVRSALGARSGRLVRLVLGESVLLAAAGGILGIVLARVGTTQLLRIAPSSIPRLYEVEMNPVVLVFAIAIVAVTGIAFGILPAIAAARQDPSDALKEGGTGRIGGKRRQATRRGLVIAQLSLAVALVLGAGVLLRSFGNLYRVDAGIRTDHVLTLRISPSTARHAAGEAMVAYHGQVLDRVGAIPGVTGVAEVSNLPLASGMNGWSFLIEGRPPATVADAPAANINEITPQYFDVLGLEVVSGRPFTDTDRAGSTPVVLISESLAKKFFPNEDAVGRRMRVFTDGWPWMEIVGIVRDVRHFGLDRAGQPTWYVPHAQGWISAYTSFPAMNVLVRTDGRPGTVAEAARSAIRDIDPTVPIENVQTMDDVVATSLGSRRFTMVLIAAFAVLALFLAAVGVYGVVAWSVLARRREIGVRIALGAAVGRVLGSVLREAFALASAGIAGGLAIAALFSAALKGLVFDISPMDPMTCLGVALVLLLTAFVAAIAPAVRASRVDPLSTLRTD
jgi:putative ABC transport system permease protein